MTSVNLNDTGTWKDRLSHVSQVGGIETSVLDNGPGRGTRIAWINTGAGLRYRVVIDRAMDIVDAFYQSHSLAWISHGGVTSPQPFSDHGVGWLRTFAGGLVTTCGITHMGVPDADERGERGLHGKISNIPAELISIEQPDPVRNRMEMSITGVMKESSALGDRLELKRKISGRLGSPVIVLEDEVYNAGNQASPHMLLYHLNLGWPLVDAGAEIIWKGKWKSREGSGAKIFKDGFPFMKCQAPLEEHRGTGEEAAFIDADTDEQGLVHCGLINNRLGFALKVTYKKSELPWLTNWQHWSPGEYVTGLEPGTNGPIGQVKARELNELILLQPGESRNYRLGFEIITEEAAINQFRKYGTQNND